MISFLVMLTLAALCVVRAITILTTSTITCSFGALPQSIAAVGNNSVSSNPTTLVQAAKSGTLTTRTDNTTGTLTMAPGHGFSTGNTISLFFAGGSQTNVTLGTVSGNSVPFSGGSGTNLPAATTPITAMLPVSETFNLVGNNATGLVAFLVAQPGDGNAAIEFLSSGPAVVLTETVSGPNPTYSWNGTTTNPLAGVTVATVRFSHGQTGARQMGAQSVFN